MIEANDGRTESFLVRLWCDTRRGPWRASLQNIRTREVIYFARPELLWGYLQAEMAETGSGNPADDSTLEKKEKEPEL